MASADGTVQLMERRVLWHYAGEAFTDSAGLSLLIWAITAAMAARGNVAVTSHEWRVRLPNGQPGARVGPATRRAVYEHTHHENWERRNARIRTVAIILSAIAIFGCPLLETRWLMSHVQGIRAIVGYYVVCPVLPFAIVGGLIAALVRWLSKLASSEAIR